MIRRLIWTTVGGSPVELLPALWRFQDIFSRKNAFFEIDKNYKTSGMTSFAEGLASFHGGVCQGFEILGHRLPVVRDMCLGVGTTLPNEKTNKVRLQAALAFVV